MPKRDRRIKVSRVRVKKLIESGMAYVDVAEKLGVSRERVRQIAAEYGFEAQDRCRFPIEIHIKVTARTHAALVERAQAETKRRGYTVTKSEVARGKLEELDAPLAEATP